VSPGSNEGGGAGEASNDVDGDAAMLRLVDRGDLDGALTLLMQRHGTAVYRFCCEALRDETLADDVQQLVFIAAFRDLPRFQRRSAVRTWLFAIAHHRVLDAAKAMRQRSSRFEPDDAADIPDPAPAQGERIDDALLHQALRWCLEGLAPRVRTAMLMRYQQGFTFEDMARICREKSGTLQARVTRALPQLRACIEAHTGGSL
jgi:RNA polymerase sigma factor (sigma-70 family)